MTKITDYQIKHAYINGQPIMYKLFVKSTLNSYIKVTKNNEIHVVVSKWMSEKVASDFIKKNILKMHTHIVNKQNKQLIDPNFNYIYLLNERYEISSLLTNYRRKYEIIGKKIYLHCNKTSDKLFLIKKILLQYCQNVIPNMFTKWEKRMNLKANLSFKWMTSKLGVCYSSSKKIVISLRLICCRKEAIDYLIVHELSHLIHPHHQKPFWNYVSSLIPNWKEIRQEVTKYW